MQRNLVCGSLKGRTFSSKPNPFDRILRALQDGTAAKFYSLPALADSRIDRLPFSIRVLLENAIRNCDEFSVTGGDVERIADWAKTATKVEIPFKPARVVLQDYAGLAAIVDLAALRDAYVKCGGNPTAIQPLVPAELVVDHSVMVDVHGVPDAVEENQRREFAANIERFQFLKWGSQAFQNLTIAPPGTGIIHQVNMERLARVVFTGDQLLYPDSVVGTDSHTTMINGLGVLGWGVGGLEAEAAVLGQPLPLLLPAVVGCHLKGSLPEGATATDLVLTINQALRAHGVVGKFVEFFGEGARRLSLPDRATVANMAPEYGATMGYFPPDEHSMEYLLQTGRPKQRVQIMREFLKQQRLWADEKAGVPQFSSVVEVDLGTIIPCVAGPKRPHDRVALKEVQSDFRKCLTNKLGFKGFGIAEADRNATTGKIKTPVGETVELKHGSLIIAAITSCTNTSNPSVMMAAGLLARNAVAKGLRVSSAIKTSLSPGSQAVSEYLKRAGLQSALDALQFHCVGYGCMTCVGNTGEIDPTIGKAIDSSKIVASAVLSGNRNFEARIHPQAAATYLASPPLVIAYALAGTVDVNFDTQPLGTGKDGKPVFLRDIWPSQAEVDQCVQKFVQPEVFQAVYGEMEKGNARWRGMSAPSSVLYPWEPSSTYLSPPPFFRDFDPSPPARGPAVTKARCLLVLGDSVTTDHISPVGRIAAKGDAGQYLTKLGVQPADFNTYGARRGNDAVMARGTFANTRLRNLLVSETGPVTVHVPSGEKMSVWQAVCKYRDASVPLIVLAGKEYGAGSARDYAAKGPYLMGIRSVIAQSFERIHRSNLAGMGIVPLQFKEGESIQSLGLTGTEAFSIDLPLDMKPLMDVTVTAEKDGAAVKKFTTTLRFDTAVEIEYWRHGGILPYVLRGRLASR